MCACALPPPPTSLCAVKLHPEVTGFFKASPAARYCATAPHLCMACCWGGRCRLRWEVCNAGAKRLLLNSRQLYIHSCLTAQSSPPFLALQVVVQKDTGN